MTDQQMQPAITLLEQGEDVYGDFDRQPADLSYNEWLRREEEIGRRTEDIERRADEKFEYEERSL